MEYNTDHFLSMLAKMNISLSDKQLQQFMTYYEMLIEKNKVMNLTAITDPTEIVTRHFLDCAALALYMPQDGRVLDVGTGAGFPGMPLVFWNVVQQQGFCMKVSEESTGIDRERNWRFSGFFIVFHFREFLLLTFGITRYII